MYDIKWIRENAEVFDRGLKRRGLKPQAEWLLALDDDTPRGDRQIARSARAAQRGIEGNRRSDEGWRFFTRRSSEDRGRGVENGACGV